ncbi:hypothetical protein AURDEDRAFT_129117 [Auricularia subglabra TFB-10046 SS5]|uniref:MYND-type domain-containing protein n=1 Tax=Auricularia subglabra (strain TFB-10046 / SS5) TaxID=717982 RepID=J0DBH5_AURST|nr:hypothetical protein AURDEDRAFT_129117 [Auricularia subglabra TFB-10046 SS5]
MAADHLSPMSTPSSCSAHVASDESSALSSPSAHKLLEELERGLRDPASPSACPVCVALFELLCMHPSVRKDNIRLLRTEHPQFLSDIMGVLTAVRNDTWCSEFALSLQTIIHNCSRHSHAMHGRVARDFTSDRCLPRLLASLCSIVNNCFPEITGRSVDGRRFRFSKYWPAQPCDLLARGPDGFHGMLRWLTNVDDASVIRTYTHVFLWCRSSFYTAFADRDATSVFLRAVCHLLKSATAALRRRQHDRARRGTIDPGHRMACLAEFLDFLAVLGTDEWPIWGEFLTGHESELLASLTPAIDACRDDQDVVRAHLRNFLYQVHSSLGDDSLRYMPSRVADKMFERDLSGGGSFELFRTLLNTLSMRRCCSLQGCPHKISSGGSLFTCASCKIPRYCSKACQTEHWGGSVYPHKVTCALLTPIVTRAPPSMAPDAFEAACRAMGVDVGQLSIIFAGLIGHRIPGACEGGSMDRDRVAAGFAMMLGEANLLHDFHLALNSTSLDLQMPALYRRLDNMDIHDELHEQLSRYMKKKVQSQHRRVR